MNKPSTIEGWKVFFNEWEQSGLTRKAYLEGSEITLPTFDYWRQRVKEQTQEQLPVVKVPTQAKSGSKTALVLRIDDRYTVEIGEGFTPSTLRSLLEVLT